MVASLKIFQNLIQNLSVGDSSCQIFIQIFEETEMLKTRIDELSKEKANQQKEYRQLQLQYEKLEERFKSEKAISLQTCLSSPIEAKPLGPKGRLPEQEVFRFSR